MTGMKFSVVAEPFSTSILFRMTLNSGEVTSIDVTSSDVTFVEVINSDV